MSLEDKLKQLTGAEDNYIQTMIPILLDYVNNDLRTDYTKEELPAGIVMFMAKAIEFNKGNGGLDSYSMGSVSYSFNMDFPASIYSLLKPYRKIRVIDTRSDD